MWWMFAPLLLLGFIVLIAGGGDEGGRVVGVLLIGISAVVLALWHLLIRYTRLELSAEGVRLVQFGYQLSQRWDQIVGIRLDKGREGLITREPMDSDGAHRLASFRYASVKSTALYDDQQKQLLGERRLIPIEAFGWYLRNDRGLLADIVRRAPHVDG